MSTIIDMRLDVAQARWIMRGRPDRLPARRSRPVCRTMCRSRTCHPVPGDRDVPSFSENSKQREDLGAPRDVSALAELALTMVAGEQFAPSTPEFDRILRSLCESLVQPDEARHRAQLDQLLRRGVSVDEVLGLYIPAAARLLGTDWVGDRLSWAAVTVGSAHLQRQVRRLSTHPLRGAPAAETGQMVLLATLEGDQHTLGACLAADSMRQAGLKVQVAMGMNADELTSLAGARPLSMIGLSVGSAKMQPEVERLVEMLRGSMTERCPIVVGGAIADPDVNAKSVVGADLITSDMSEALEFCGLPTASEMSSGAGGPSRVNAAPTRGRPV